MCITKERGKIKKKPLNCEEREREREGERERWRERKKERERERERGMDMYNRDALIILSFLKSPVKTGKRFYTEICLKVVDNIRFLVISNIFIIIIAIIISDIA